MFIESDHGGYWNLLSVASFRRDERKGVLHLVFPVPGGNVVIKSDHPQFQQIDHFLRSATLRHDSAAPPV